MNGTLLPWSRYWITGSSSGIGRALAIELAAPGRTLILSGRSRKRLVETAELCEARGAVTELLPFDMTDESARTAALTTLAERGIPVEVLINNAGVSQRAMAVDTGYTVDTRMVEVNLMGAIQLSKAVLPGMIDAGTGLVLTISSIAAFLPSPGRSLYNATKAAQVAYFRTLRNEIYSSGVHVMMAIPGFVRTSISENALTADGSAQGILDRNQANGISPERAAGEIVAGMRRRRETVWTGVPPQVRLFIALAGLAPGISDRVLRKVRVR